MRNVITFVTCVVLVSGGINGAVTGRQVRAQAEKIHREAIVVDGHVHGLFPGAGGRQVDLESMKAGGIDALCYALPLRTEGITDLARTVREDAAFIREELKKYPRKAEIALNAADIRRNHRAGIGSILFGLEYFEGLFGGRAETLEVLYAAGVRTITVTNSPIDPIVLTSENELNDLGKAIVAGMNRLGMLIDITHMGDDKQRAFIRESQAPVIASHSNARRVVDIGRNLPDDIIQAIAEKGGAVLLVFNAACLTGHTGPGRPESGMTELLRHIGHIVRTAGIDHVGIGTDYGGSGHTAPKDLETAARFPTITAHLLEAGYSAADAAKIMGGNFLRVLEAVERGGRIDYPE